MTVSRDYGNDLMLEMSIDGVSESDTVMRVLDRSATVTTRFGGGFVQSIDGVSGGTSGGRAVDWFFYVNGVESGRGGADFRLRGGESIWWDHRDWVAASRVPAVVGQFPEPFASGYDGNTWPTVVECMGVGPACKRVRGTLENLGANLAGGGAADAGQPGGDAAGHVQPGDAIRVLVGPWSKVSRDAVADRIDAGPETSGVFARFDSTAEGAHLIALDQQGGEADDLGGAAGLIAATRRLEDPPVWVVTGGTQSAVEAAARALDPETLHNHYAVSIGDKGPVALPEQ